MTPASSTVINFDGLNLLKRAETYLAIAAFTTTGTTVTIAVPMDFAQFIPVGIVIGSDNASDDAVFIDTDTHTYDATRGVLQATNTSGKYSITFARKSGGSPTSALKFPVLLIACP